jgi:putative ABC transport system permease protein
MRGVSVRSQARLCARLAWRNLRRRPGQTLLLLLVLSTATTTLSLAMAVGRTGDGSWDRVWRATSGFHVSAEAGATSATVDTAAWDLARARSDLAGLAGAPEVVAVSGPWDVLYASAELDGRPMELAAQVRGPAPAAVGHPLVTAGRWLGDDDGVVLEAGLAATMRLGVGDTVTIAGRRLPVRGVATTVSQNRFPLTMPGLVWVNAPTGRQLQAAGAQPGGVAVELRLADPAAAAAFVAAHRPGLPDAGAGWAQLATWQQRRADAHPDLGTLAAALAGVGGLLAGLTVATAAVLVTGRLSAQTRQVGTLKAVGVTPRQITAVLLAEQLALAAVATLVGLAAGTLLAPPLARSSVALFGAPQAPPVTLARVVVVAAVAVAVVVLATVGPALRGARHSTLRSLAADVRPPRRPSRLGQLAGTLGLPLPVVLGLRSMLRRPGRTLVNTIGLTLGVAMVVVTLALQDSLQILRLTPPGPDIDAAAHTAIRALYDQVRVIVVAAAVGLLALAAVNALIIAAFAARDSARNHAVLRTLGATPGQTVTALVVSQLGACLAACLAGIPLGMALFGLADGGDLPPVRLEPRLLAAVAVAVPVLFSLLMVIPARRLARQPVTPLLASE